MNSRYVIFFIWLLGFVLCFASIFLKWSDLTLTRQRLLSETFETFAPYLSIMLVFMFSDHAPAKKPVGGWPLLIAILSSVIFIGPFCFMSIRLVLEQTNGKELLDTFALLRPKLSFLVAGMVTYYFAKSGSY